MATTPETHVPESGAQTQEGDEEPQIIRLSSDEYFFPTSRRASSVDSGTLASGSFRADSRTSSFEAETAEPPIIPFSTVQSRLRAEVDAHQPYKEYRSERLASFKDQTVNKPLARRPALGDSDDEYEETLVYIDLDDIPNVDELFAVEPDDFLSFQTKRQREIPKPKKATHPEIKVKIHNFDSPQPIVQIGSRYYVGNYEEPMGSSLFFQEQEPPGKPVPPQRLESIVPEQIPKRDKVFHEKLCSDKYSEYDLVANVDKVLKMTRREVRIAGGDLCQLPATPGGLPPLPPQKSWPGSYTPSEVFSGKYHADKNMEHGPFDSSFSEIDNSKAPTKSAVSTASADPISSPQKEIMMAIGGADTETSQSQDSILGLESF